MERGRNYLLTMVSVANAQSAWRKRLKLALAMILCRDGTAVYQNFDDQCFFRVMIFVYRNLAGLTCTVFVSFAMGMTYKMRKCYEPVIRRGAGGRSSSIFPLFLGGMVVCIHYNRNGTKIISGGQCHPPILVVSFPKKEKAFSNCITLCRYSIRRFRYMISANPANAIRRDNVVLLSLPNEYNLGLPISQSSPSIGANVQGMVQSLLGLKKKT